MRAANVASTLGTVQLCCSKFGLGADGMVEVGDIVSHDAISRRANNHSARQRRTDMFRMILWRQPLLRMSSLPIVIAEFSAKGTDLTRLQTAVPDCASVVLPISSALTWTSSLGDPIRH